MKDKLTKLRKKIEQISPFAVLAGTAMVAVGTVAVLQMVQNAAQERLASDVEREYLDRVERGEIVLDETIQ